MADQIPEKDPASRLARTAFWNKTYRRYYRLWVSLARSAEISSDEAQDVVQNIIAGILAEPTRGFESMEHARNYVAKSVINRAKGAKTRAGKRSAWEEGMEHQFAVLQDEYKGDDKIRREALRQIIRRLSRRDFNILKLRFYSGFTLAQASEILNIPISTIASREAVILRKIRQQLRKKGI